MFNPWVGKIPWRKERLPTPGSGLENSMDCIVHGVPKSQTQLSNFHFEKRFNGDLQAKPKAGGSNDLRNSNEQYFSFQDFLIDLYLDKNVCFL